MKWGVRRYQNEDGSLTPAGKARYDDGTSYDASNTSATKTTSNKKKTAREKEAIYEKQTSMNRTARNIGYASKLAGTVSYTVGQNMYNKYKNAATPTQVNVMQAMGHTGKVLNKVGDALVLGSFIKQQHDFAKNYF